jgi:hypothetical protein
MNQVRQEIYVMRLWHERSYQDECSDAWRVTITDTCNQEKFHFASLEALFGFFRERLEDTEDSR